MFCDDEILNDGASNKCDVCGNACHAVMDFFHGVVEIDGGDGERHVRRCPDCITKGLHFLVKASFLSDI